MLARLRAYRTSGDALTVLVKKNIVQSLFIKGASVAINLALVPLTLGLLSRDLYGIWITLSSVVAWFTFIDLGLGNGLRNKVTELLARNERAQARVYVSTLYTATVLISLFFLLLYALVHPWIDWASLLKVPPRWQREVSLLASMSVGAFGLQLVLRNINFVLLAVQRSAVNALFPLLSNVITLSVLLGFRPFMAGSILNVGLALLLPQLFVLVGFHLYFFRHELRDLRPGWLRVRLVVLEQFGGLGLSFFVIQMAWVVIFTTANLLITRLLGPAYVTQYDIAYKYFGLLPMGFSLLMTPLWSAFGHAYHTHDTAWIRRTLHRIRQVWLVVTLGQFGLLLLAGYLIPQWVGRAVTVPTELACAMVIYYGLTSYGSIYVNLLNGAGTVRYQMLTSVAAIILMIPLAYGLVRFAQLGVAGVVAAITICSLYGALVAPHEARRLLNHLPI